MNQPISGGGGGSVAVDNKKALWSMILGIVGLVLCCGPAGIVAWIMGQKELQAIDAGLSAEENRGMAKAGKILGIVGTVLWVVGMILYVVMIIGGVAAGGLSEMS